MSPKLCFCDRFRDDEKQQFQCSHPDLFLFANFDERLLFNIFAKTLTGSDVLQKEDFTKEDRLRHQFSHRLT